MYLVLQSKRKENKLYFDPTEKEYIYIHKGAEQWRMKGDDKLYNYVKEQKRKGEYLDINICYSFPIYRVYSNSCQYFANEDLKKWQNIPHIIEVIK